MNQTVLIMKILTLQALLFLIFTSFSYSEETTIKDVSGKILEVRFEDFSKEKGVELISLSNRKKYTIPLDKLDEESQAKVNEWVKKGGHLSKDFLLAFMPGKNSKPDKKEDDKAGKTKKKKQKKPSTQETLNPKVKITNDSVRKASSPVTLEVILIGRPLSDKNSAIVSHIKNFEIPSLKAKENKDFEFGPVVFQAFKETKEGAEYFGFALFAVSNEEVVSAKYSSSLIEQKFGERLRKKKKGVSVSPK